MTMTMTSHSSSPKLCANTKCKKILQVTRPSWKCPNGCFVRLCDECSLCDSCLNPQRSISPPSWSRPAASFRKRSSEKTSVISTSSIPVRGPAAVQTPCLLNSSNTEPQPQPQVDISVRPTQPSWLGERKNSSVKRSSQIRASHVIKDKTAVGTEHSPSRHLLGSKSFTAQSRHGNDHLLDRYMPKQVTECSDAKITPLFEKKLTASDAGRVGRLVLPKRCAEAYFPPVNEPFGEPLSIQDTEGKNWDLNLRFWPNNNSRMYVLEGFSLVVKSVELVEGDVVTFSRLEPEGKLIMGYRKAKSTALSLKQAIVTVSPRNDVSKGNTSSAAVSQMKPDDPTSNIQSEVVRAKAAGRSKRKSSKMGWGSDINEPEKEMVELDLTSKEAQELVRPPLGGRVPKSVVIDGVEIMGYEDVPVIGRPTIIENLVNKMIQWAQCEGCYKWRKVPMDVVIPAGWTCSHNQWDPHRSCCSATEEMMSDNRVKNMFPRSSDEGSSKKMKIIDQQPEPLESVMGRDADAVIEEENVPPPPALPSPAKATTKHPRHRPGCSCIVCIQAPSGTKHHSTCTCSGCMTVRRRHQTVNSRRGKKPSGTTRRKRTRRTVNTRKPAIVGGSELNQKKPSPQPDSIIMKQADSSCRLEKPPGAQQQVSRFKPLDFGTSSRIFQIKPTEDHQTPKSASAPALAKTTDERRLIDLNLVPETDEED